MAQVTSGASAERVVLRAALGPDSYTDIEVIMSKLDALEQRGIIGVEGLSTIIRTLAEDIVAQKVLRDFDDPLSSAQGAADTLRLEDSKP